MNSNMKVKAPFPVSTLSTAPDHFQPFILISRPATKILYSPPDACSRQVLTRCQHLLFSFFRSSPHIIPPSPPPRLLEPLCSTLHLSLEYDEPASMRFSLPYRPVQQQCPSLSDPRPILRQGCQRVPHPWSGRRSRHDPGHLVHPGCPG